MNPILHPIFAVSASVPRQELARQVAYLKEENKILRARLPQRLVATPQEKRRLRTAGRKLGVQLKDLISIGSSAWVSLQARNFLMFAEDMGLAPDYVVRDSDAKFSAQFDEVLKSSGAIVKRNTPMSPNLRAHVERFIQTLKFEWLNRFVIVAEKHLDHVCRVWSRHHNEERPHSSRNHMPPDFKAPPDEATIVRVNDIVCTSKIGGVINSYSRRAA